MSRTVQSPTSPTREAAPDEATPPVTPTARARRSTAPSPESAAPSAATADPSHPKRQQVSQADVPSMTLEDALRVPRALAEYAFRPVSPLDAAKAIGMQPKSGTFRNLMGAAWAYGLTDSGAYADKIGTTALAQRIVKPKIEGDDLVAMREAFLKPRVVREFLTAYKDNKVPREDIAKNVLEGFGVPANRTVGVLNQILDDARRLGFITMVGPTEYVQLDGVSTSSQMRLGDTAVEATNGHVPEFEDDHLAPTIVPGGAPIAPAAQTSPSEAKRVYITHGSNTAFVELLKKFLKFGDMEAVVSVEKESVSLPVPEKVIGDMRNCGAAIIHVDAERKLIDADGKEHIVLNENVLIEIGAAMALYGRRFILLVREGVKLPSNLQGLYEVRYQGDGLDAEVAMRLLEAIADIKNHPLPGAAAA
jgi:hypothetical protein